ncbi:hypothetical protein [Wenyingzhuangia marina]|nr:hypothetical protein [Wenyingzhuangia marina]GGF66995.1 hypothetical protein GCM10011397_07630 [Wenyingzhuangia marina]
MLSKEELNDISTKLDKLKLGFSEIDSETDIEVITTEEVIELNTINSSLRRKSTYQNLKTKISADCEHEVYEEFHSDNESYEITSRFFDLDKNEITSCDIYDRENVYLEGQTGYIVEEEIKIKAVKYESNYSSTSIFKTNTTKITDTKYEFLTSNNMEITGALNFSGDIFRILNGSYMNTSVKTTIILDEYLFSDDFDPVYEIDFLYKIEFDVNKNTYHFDMILTENELPFLVQETSDELIEIDYDLLNNANEKIGSIQYNLDFKTHREWFELFDLNGNKI